MLDTISNVNEPHTIQDFYRNLKEKLPGLAEMHNL